VNIRELETATSVDLAVFVPAVGHALDCYDDFMDFWLPFGDAREPQAWLLPLGTYRQLADRGGPGPVHTTQELREHAAALSAQIRAGRLTPYAVADEHHGTGVLVLHDLAVALLRRSVHRRQSPARLANVPAGPPSASSRAVAFTELFPGQEPVGPVRLHRSNAFDAALSALRADPVAFASVGTAVRRLTEGQPAGDGFYRQTPQSLGIADGIISLFDVRGEPWAVVWRPVVGERDGRAVLHVDRELVALTPYDALALPASPPPFTGPYGVTPYGADSALEREPVRVREIAEQLPQITAAFRDRAASVFAFGDGVREAVLIDHVTYDDYGGWFRYQVDPRMPTVDELAAGLDSHLERMRTGTFEHPLVVGPDGDCILMSLAQFRGLPTAEVRVFD
jgi:hypothetical protein